ELEEHHGRDRKERGSEVLEGGELAPRGQREEAKENGVSHRVPALVRGVDRSARPIRCGRGSRGRGEGVDEALAPPDRERDDEEDGCRQGREDLRPERERIVPAPTRGG